jgi:hypothetical protein
VGVPLEKGRDEIPEDADGGNANTEGSRRHVGEIEREPTRHDRIEDELRNHGAHAPD